MSGLLSMEGSYLVKEKTRVEARPLEPGEEGSWDRFVASSAMGTFFHLTGWGTIVEHVLGHESFRLIARDTKGVSGVFPISLVRNKLFGDCLVSLPLAVYGGICADDEESYFSLLKAGSDLASRLGVRYLEMRNLTEPFPTSLPGKDLYVTFTQDLSAGPDKLLQGLPRDTRYAVRKSLKAGLDWTEDLSIDEFYEIYARSVHRLGTPVFSKELFASLRREFPKQCRLFGVRKGKTAIAGVLCLYYQDRVMPYYGGSLPEFYKDSPNNFMYWSLICQSHREGFRQFDFGRSKRGTGSFNFKSSWAMQVTELPYKYQLIRAKKVPELSPVDQKFRLPVVLWKQMPYSWTKILGPRLIRWIPSV
ncbi:MAG TPA: FemAB family XrtA/PEP-CTERM system-associated protein [Bryobacteraceae bacterium]|nr:FemAB family XrtA/PEP-CTERM system-associated protein [Bryobacteraceae bacterium]HXJ41503.1 FemAB family XrtA/PEP-CTERM system-associated protein [Bryobacteraceae bacterium]